VGHEQVHAEFLSQGKDLAVMDGSLVDVWGSTMCGDFAKEAQGIRLIVPFLALTSQGERALDEGVRLLQMAGQHLRLPQEKTAEHLGLYSFGCRRLFQRPREQRYGLSDAPGQSIHRTQGRRYSPFNILKKANPPQRSISLLSALASLKATLSQAIRQPRRRMVSKKVA
jgi:hypothetical protein